MQVGADSEQRVVPMAELLYFDPGQFWLDEYAGAIIESCSIGPTRGLNI
jgi:hypothetical protein